MMLASVENVKEKRIEAIIFDLDGTLWDSRKEIQKTWNMAIQQNGNVRELIGFEELSGCLGLPMDEIARKLFSDCDENIQKKIMDDCCVLENDYLYEHGATLFPKLEDTLGKLKEKYRLFIVSNCQSGYIEAFLNAHKLSQYFDDIECWGNTGKFKGANNILLMERNKITKAIYVGDTSGDEQSAREAKIPFVYCKYGFGKAENPDFEIDTFEELLNIL